MRLVTANVVSLWKQTRAKLHAQFLKLLNKMRLLFLGCTCTQCTPAYATATV